MISPDLDCDIFHPQQWLKDEKSNPVLQKTNCLVGGTTEEGSRGDEKGEEEECYLRLLNEMCRKKKNGQYDENN